MTLEIVREGSKAYIQGTVSAELDAALSDQLCWVDPIDFDHKTRFYKDGVLYRGVIDQAVHLCNQHGYEVTISGPVTLNTQTFPHWKFKGSYRDGQEECVQAIIKATEGVVQAPPGFGKTVVIAAATAALKGRTLILTQQKEPFDQAHSTFLTMTNISPGKIGVGEIDYREVCVATVQTLISHIKEGNEATLAWLRDVRFVFTDECHHAPNDSYLMVFDQLEAVEGMYGVSATPEREDDQQMLLEALFGEIIFQRTYGEQIDNGSGVPITVFWEDVPEKDYEYTKKRRKLSDEPEEEVPTWRKRQQFQKVYKDYILKGATGRNKQIVNFAKEAVSDGLTVAIIVKLREHAAILQKMIPGSEIMLGSSSPKDKAVRQEVLDRLWHRETKVVVTTVMEEAVDVPTLDCIVLAAGGKSALKVRQRLRNTRVFDGNTRSGRYKKSRGFVYYPYDNADFLRTHSRDTLSHLRKIVKEHPDNKIIHIQ